MRPWKLICVSPEGWLLVSRTLLHWCPPLSRRVRDASRHDYHAERPDKRKAPYLGSCNHRGASREPSRRGSSYVAVLAGAGEPELAEPVGEPAGRDAADEPGAEGQGQRHGRRPRPGHHRSNAGVRPITTPMNASRPTAYARVAGTGRRRGSIAIRMSTRTNARSRVERRPPGRRCAAFFRAISCDTATDEVGSYGDFLLDDGDGLHDLEAHARDRRADHAEHDHDGQHRDRRPAKTGETRGRDERQGQKSAPRIEKV